MEEDALFLAWDILVLGSLATFFRVVLPILNPPRNLPLVTQFFLFLVNISSISCLFKKKKKKVTPNSPAEFARVTCVGSSKLPNYSIHS